MVAVIVIHPYSFVETRVLSIEKSITPFDGENKVTEKRYPIRGDKTKKNP